MDAWILGRFINWTKRYTLALPIVLIMALYSSCAERQNSVLAYLENAELQYETKEQEATILEAMNDILRMPSNELIQKRYPDYTGNENEWDLPTLLARYFVPDSEDASISNELYQEVRNRQVRKTIQQIILEIESD